MCDNVSCKNELNLHKLCADSIKACSIKAEKFNTDELCLQSAEVKDLFVERETVNDLCARNANIDSLCVNNLKVGSFNKCEKYRAAATYSANTVYTLGSIVNWNIVLDDPNGNIALAPFYYTVPVSGYYMASFHVDSTTLAGVGVIVGTPVGRLQISVNGNPLTKDLAPCLSFSDLQSSTLTSLVLLNAGDVLTMKYDVLVVDSILGLIPYVGTVVIQGNGSFPGQSGFGIHYLSSLDCAPGEACPICPLVEVVCEPCEPHAEAGARAGAQRHASSRAGCP